MRILKKVVRVVNLSKYIDGLSTSELTSAKLLALGEIEGLQPVLIDVQVKVIAHVE